MKKLLIVTILLLPYLAYSDFRTGYTEYFFVGHDQNGQYVSGEAIAGDYPHDTSNAYIAGDIIKKNTLTSFDGRLINKNTAVGYDDYGNFITAKVVSSDLTRDFFCHDLNYVTVDLYSKKNIIISYNRPYIGKANYYAAKLLSPVSQSAESRMNDYETIQADEERYALDKAALGFGIDYGKTALASYEQSFSKYPAAALSLEEGLYKGVCGSQLNFNVLIRAPD